MVGAFQMPGGVIVTGGGAALRGMTEAFMTPIMCRQNCLRQMILAYAILATLVHGH